MTIGRSRNSISNSLRQRARRASVVERTARRELLLEQLEDGGLLAAGPRLAGIQPNNSVLFSFEDSSVNVRNVAPKELNIRFDENQQIDANTLSAIRITR